MKQKRERWKVEMEQWTRGPAAMGHWLMEYEVGGDGPLAAVGQKKKRRVSEGWRRVVNIAAHTDIVGCVHSSVLHNVAIVQWNFVVLIVGSWLVEIV